jgi:hypothetical protein
LYFDSKTFFLIPKGAFTEEQMLDDARRIFRKGIPKS